MLYFFATIAIEKQNYLKLHDLSNSIKSILFISVESEEEDETDQSFQTVAIVGTVGGVVAVTIICVTVYLVMRSRNKRRQNGDLNVVT